MNTTTKTITILGYLGPHATILTGKNALLLHYLETEVSKTLERNRYTLPFFFDFPVPDHFKDYLKKIIS
ncbi:hypothetical protein [Spongiimicrobium sp. 2-473A-2-J]|uniref:hypothetical protein n=1 Tax=Eudoraea algarum TaxID=3417568 RepID=UPI003D36FB20